MKDNYKQKVVIIGLILAVIGICSAFFLQKTPFIKSSYVEEVVVTPAAYVKITQSPVFNTSSWQPFIQKDWQFSIKYPDTVMLDPRQTSEKRVYAFILKADSKEPLPGKVTTLYIADTKKSGTDGFSAFRKGDCQKECPISYKTVPWITINNVFGIKNPLPDDKNNYYLTDKNQKGSVINLYIGGYVNRNNKEVLEKIALFDAMIKTSSFSR